MTAVALHAGESRRSLGTFLLVLPALLVFLGLVVAPLSYFFVQSFWKATSFSVVPGFSLQNYTKVFAEYGEALLRTLAIALSVAFITTGIAFFFSYAVRFTLGRLGTPLLLLALTTLFGGYLVKIYAWRTILGLDGILNSALLSSGLITEPLGFLLFNQGAVIITLTHYLLPLAILPIYGALRDVDDSEIAAARDVGAGWWRTVQDIALPQVQSGLLASFAMVFLLAAGDYVTPALVGSPGAALFGNFIQTQFSLRMNTPMGSAMSFTLIVCCILVLALVALAMRRLLRPR